MAASVETRGRSGRGLGGCLLLFAALYGGYGALSPFLPTFLKERGLSAQEISWLLAAAMLVRLVAGPLIGRLADRTRATRALLALTLASAGGLTLAFLPWHGFLPLLAFGLVQAAATAPLGPLADALALAAARGGRVFEYGWVRAAGSAAFIAATALTGLLVGSWGSAAGLWACGGLFGLAALVTMLARGDRSDPSRHLRAEDGEGRRWGWFGRHRTASSGPTPTPDPSPQGGGDAPRQTTAARGMSCPTRQADQAPDGFAALLAIPRFRRLVLAAALVIGAHAMHDAFAVIVWQEAGIAPGMAGLLWSESVAAEIAVFLWAGPRLIGRIGPADTIALAALAGALRWAVQAETSWLPALLAIQGLHGLTFAALHLSALAVIEASVPERLRATALSVYGTVGLGLATALLTLAAGQLYAAFGPPAFLAMSGLSLAAIPVAWSLRGKACVSAPKAVRK